jgi:ankyrin repeat protein
MRRRAMKTLCILLLSSFAACAASSPVADAAQNRDAAALQALLKQHAAVNAAQPDGTTALHWAAHWNDSETIGLLLQAGADAKAVNHYGATPLSEAAALGNAVIIEQLLKAGADPNTRTTADGETVLMTSARAGNPDAVKALLDHGADVNAKEAYRGQTALMWAAAERHAGVVKLLLERGADWKVQSSFRETKIPKLSTASSISPISRGGLTAFLFAAREGDIETAKVMLDHAVDVNQTDVDGTSGLVVSIMNKQYTFAKFLLDRGADPNVTDVKGRDALYAAVDMRNEDWSALPMRKEQDPLPSMELIKAILAHGGKPNAQLTHNRPDAAEWIMATWRWMKEPRRSCALPDRAMQPPCEFCLKPEPILSLSLRMATTRCSSRPASATATNKRKARTPRRSRRLNCAWTRGSILVRPTTKAKLRCMEPRTGAPISWSNSWSNMARSSTPSPRQVLRPWTSPWERTASAFRFHTTAQWRCCEAWAALREHIE